MQSSRTRFGALLPTPLGYLLPFVGLYVPAHATPAYAPTLPSITAEHVRSHAPSGVELARLRVELSPEGMRVRERAHGEDVEMIQSFATERLWFVDRRRRIAHRVPLKPSSLPAGNTTLAESGFLGTEPCAGLRRHAGRSGSWRGRDVEAWTCLDAGGEPVAGELFERQHGIVVRRETADGHVDELHDIRTRRFESGHFVPSPRFRRVGARELIHGAPAIGSFDELAADTGRVGRIERAGHVEHEMTGP